jgi:hypothetical protein
MKLSDLDQVADLKRRRHALKAHLDALAPSARNRTRISVFIGSGYPLNAMNRVDLGEGSLRGPVAAPVPDELLIGPGFDDEAMHEGVQYAVRRELERRVTFIDERLMSLGVEAD